MKFAYADPPYINQSKRLYKNHKDYAGEVNHKVLIKKLVEQYPDGWALSCSTVSLKEILILCPDDVRIMAWVKPFHAWKNIRPSYAWEPVIVSGGRKANFKAVDKKALGFKDYVEANITLKKGLAGAKPQKFCLWLFEILNIQPGDTLDDLYPGTEIVSKMFNWYIDQYKDDATDLKEISKNNAVEYINGN